MTLHTGPSYGAANVSIRPPIPTEILKISPADDVVDVVQSALLWAQTDNRVHYFSVYEQHTLVGAIYLHDINAQTGEALIGYHLFHQRERGQGIGAKMLGLLQQYVVYETVLQRLIIITDKANGASRGIAAKCGFKHISGAREDPENLVVYAWEVSDGHKA
jgi:RimJ/RimL family protein N-acetyltransferase